MKTYVIDDPELGRVSYADRKRTWWLLSVLMPLLPLVGIALATGTQPVGVVSG